MRGAVSGKPELNRRINASLVLGLIRGPGPVSRAELAKRTGIRPASISEIVEDLIQRGLIVEGELGPSTGGRQPVLLSINPSGFFGIGVEIGEDGVNGVLVDLSGEVLSSARVPLAETDPDSVVRGVASVVEKVQDRARIPSKRLGGLGVAVPGIVSRQEGSVVLSRPLKWENVSLRSMLKEATGLETLVLNNATAGALSELLDKTSDGIRSLLYILVYLRHIRQTTITSVGCGIVLDGRAYLGEGQMAGEIRVDIEHPLATAAQKLGRSAPSKMEQLVDPSIASRKEIAAVWDAFAESLGRVVSRGIDFLNPGGVVIGSDTPELEAVIGTRLRDVIRDNTVAGLVAGLHGDAAQRPAGLRFSPLRTETLARGAIVPHMQELSLVPQLHDSVLM